MQLCEHSITIDLHQSLKEGDFCITFQPKVDVVTHKLVGAEALLRWNSRIANPLSPEIWIPMAERAGLMKEITHWLIVQVADRLANEPSSTKEMVIGVNISPLFLDDQMADYIIDVFQKRGLALTSLEIEITETAPAQNLKKLAGIVQRLRQAGVKVALDDFGCGYSSMVYLVEIPVDSVKIDKNFIHQAPRLAVAKRVLRSLIDLAHEVNVKVVCEGVETLEQYNMVRALKGDIVQGYLFSKPLYDIKELSTIQHPLFLKVLESPGLEWHFNGGCLEQRHACHYPA